MGADETPARGSATFKDMIETTKLLQLVSSLEAP